nr:hypothetical protein RKHAN_01186 [Rhizobium sp. Khangiran2]
MFNRINTGGTKANEAEVRRGALPGPISSLIEDCADDGLFASLTPIAEKLVAEREREELTARFFTFLDRAVVEDGAVLFPGWKDRPREYIFDFVKEANARAENDPGYPAALKEDFLRTLSFVDRNFPNGFRKTSKGTQVPRVRFEAIAVGSALALRQRPEIENQSVDVSGWIDGEEFQEITTSDAANVRSKLQNRIGFVLARLTEQ